MTSLWVRPIANLDLKHFKGSMAYSWQRLRSATGWLEERLQSVRIKCNQNLEKQNMSASHS